ncbi:MAG: ATP-binding cassette domain-containing protein [Candidatus Edwardsbacteria bacterium]|nr:ATP-binding cassette domain-containing protein [Candidatus Edwardsbacteria bacterium]
MKIVAYNLSKSFDGKPVLKDVSLTIDNSGIYALVGPNGSGKTTLMRMLALLEKIDSGKLKYKVRDTEGYATLNTSPGVRRKMALIHNPAVMLSGTVRYNLEYGLRVRGVSPPERRRRSDQALETLSLRGFGKREARTLSAGEIQRVALGRVLTLDPEVVFLDEPTANLDPLSAKLIEKTILDLASRGKKVVLATHNLWQVERIADWVWFLNDGVISISGTAQDVLHKGDQAFWGKFLGRDNLFKGEIVKIGNGKLFQIGDAKFEVATGLEGPAMASLNPNEIILSSQKLVSSARNVLEGVVTEAVSEGGLYKVTVDVGIPLDAAITKASWDEMGLQKGSRVYAVFKASSVRVWKEE